MPLSETELVARLNSFGQAHLLEGLDALGPSRRSAYLETLSRLDLELLRRLHIDRAAPADEASPEETLEPLRARSWETLDIGERAARQNLGARLLREGKVAAFLVAGGQGTRLGMTGPKGMCDIGLPSGKSLFQLQAERLLNLSRRAGRPIPWGIMTSPDNHAETTAFFSAHRNFGYPETSLRFFSQEELPVLDDEGRILLKAPGALSLGANGNGGCFRALESSGTLAAWKAAGVEWVFLYAVDNALVRVCDPRFVGFAASQGLPVASKAVARAHAGEKVGVFGSRGGRPTVIEYSELSETEAMATDSEGKLRFRAGNIAIHLFHREFLEDMAKVPLPYHAAHKKIPFWTSAAGTVQPEAPNAWKYELFMFDAFTRSAGMSVLEVAREEEFAPVKNAAGDDSPESARNLSLELHRSWALAAGMKEAEMDGFPVEVSPLTSYAGEGLSRESFSLIDKRYWSA